MSQSVGLGRGRGCSLRGPPSSTAAGGMELAQQLQDTHIEDSDGKDREKVVSFDGKSLKLDTEQDAQIIVDAINEHECMQGLDLSGNTLGIDAAQAIGEALTKHPELKRAIWFDIFTSRLRSEIPTAMSSLCRGMMRAGTQLVELDLSDNAFGPDGIRSVQELLQSSVCYTLQILKFNNNGLGTVGGTMLANSLTTLYNESKKALTLKVFICGRNRLENKGAIALAKAFKCLGSLEVVSMPQNGIYHEGVTALASALANNTHLTSLNLNDNTLTHKGALAISKCLSNWQQLENLNLGDCLLKTPGIKLIAAAIKPHTHKNLKSVNFSYNELSCEGGEIILRSLKGKAKLTSVDLNGNQFGELGSDAVRTLAQQLNVSNALQILDDDEGTNDDGEGDSEGSWVDEEEEDNVGGVRDVSPPSTPPPLPSPQADTVCADNNSDVIRADQNTSASDFLHSPSASKLLGLCDGDVTRTSQRLLQHVQEGGDTLTLTDHIISLASVIPTSQAHKQYHIITALVTTSADHILTHMCKSSWFNEMVFTNRLLEHLHLIKSEEGEGGKPGGSPNRSLLVLMHHVVTQPYFPTSSRQILQFFLARPSPKLDQFANLRHQLLQALYQL